MPGPTGFSAVVSAVGSQQCRFLLPPGFPRSGRVCIPFESLHGSSHLCAVLAWWFCGEPVESRRNHRSFDEVID